ncbi:anti-anti-sigma factor [Bacillus sp. FJAT-27225]|uniref:STAS domain-containing protein n=1 Tax=Bacillus sp. FJAT-27225 TaxID=1743144 RepID=UPI00080C3235|nr:STAS domain-containing protein [Bacillus sp. FJAT-27225]OCA84393.1 anti-anti-sigma factor [Bacillus sp. FJAT-27225]
MAIEKKVESPHINVGGLDFEWNLKKGQFLFEKEDAVLFWISSAMKTFFDTIEEVSGGEAAALVLEATGFRQGLIVSNYFTNLNVSVKEASSLIPNTYASAGWGTAIIKELDIENKTLKIEMKNSWEYKINKAQGKKASGKYLPAHYAGIFGGMLGTNLWYRVVEDQLAGDECTVVEYFPSSITVSTNIHELARRKESEKIRELEELVEEKTKDLQELVKEISSPIIPVLEGIVVVPLIGKYDESRSENLLVKTLFNLPAYKANYLILDLTGLDHEVEEYGIDFIQKLGSAASLVGIETILVGISSELGAAVTQSGINLSKFQCFQTLQHGIYYALGQSGRKIL